MPMAPLAFFDKILLQELEIDTSLNKQHNQIFDHHVASVH